MTYTLDYLEDGNEGNAKDEIASEVHRIAASKGEIYEKFVEVCNAAGLDTDREIVSLVFQCINDESFAERVLNVDMSMGGIREAENMEKDLEYVLELRDKYDLDRSGGMDIDVESIISERLSASVAGPFGNLGDGVSENGGGLESAVRKMNSRLNEIESKVDDDGSDVVEFSDDSREDRKEEVRDMIPDSGDNVDPVDTDSATEGDNDE